MNTIIKPNVNERSTQGDSKVSHYSWKTIDCPGVFLEIPKTALLIDRSYQRSPDGHQKILRMAGAWSWLSCGALIVADRGGSFYVVDGQHRLLAAMKRADISDLPCLVFQSEGAVEEAGGFLGANKDRRPIRAVQAFQAKLTAGDETAKKVNLLIQQTGRSISTGGNGASCFSAIDALTRAVTYHEASITRLWPTIVDLCDGEQISKDLIDSLLEIERRMQGETLSTGRWRQRLLQIGYNEIRSSILKAKGYFGRSGAKIGAIGVINAINYGLRNKLVVAGLNPETV